MIRASELAGRPVIDIDAAEKMGTIEKLILDPDGRRVAGFVIVQGGGFPGNKEHTTIPASAVHAIGPDALTIKRDETGSADIARLEALPRGSDVIGRKVVTQDGRYLGKVDDVLIENVDGRIFGYVLTDHKGKGKHPYLPADANLKAGKDLIVASESAMRYEWKDEDAPARPGGWTDPMTFSDEPGVSRETNPRV
jgi:uncharacterized protein YrrD